MDACTHIAGNGLYWLPNLLSFFEFGRQGTLLATQFAFLLPIRSSRDLIDYPTCFPFSSSVANGLYWLPNLLSFSSSVAKGPYWLPNLLSFYQFGRQGTLLTTQLAFLLPVRSPRDLIGYPTCFPFSSSVAKGPYWLPNLLSFFQFGRQEILLATQLAFLFPVGSPRDLIDYPTCFPFSSSVAKGPYWLPNLLSFFQFGRQEILLATQLLFLLPVR